MAIFHQVFTGSSKHKLTKDNHKEKNVNLFLS